MKNYIGIDLGTTKSTVSVITSEDKKIRTLPIYQYNKEFKLEKSKLSLDSTLYIKREAKKIYVGEFAKKIYSQGDRALTVIRSIKPRIGGDSVLRVPLERDRQDLKEYNMTELTAVLLKSIKNSLEFQLETTDEDVVTLTIPAGFNSDERLATLEAAKMAGYKNVELLDEPTAVLLNYLNTQEVEDDFFTEKRNVLVYDIGGGTLDISVASIEKVEEITNIDILGISKRLDFGGDNIDRYIAAYFLKEFERINKSLDVRDEEEQAIIIARLVSEAENYKKQFNEKIIEFKDNPRRKKRVKKSVNFEIIDGLHIADLTITDDLLKDILYPVIEENGILIKPIKLILGRMELKKEDIDLVIITGGSGEFYLIEETIKEFFGNFSTEIVSYTSENAVSVGASLNSYNKNDYRLNNKVKDSILIKKEKGFDEFISSERTSIKQGSYIYKFDIASNRLDLFLYYGRKKDKPYKYTEIGGVFKKLNRWYEPGEEIQLDWEIDKNKIIHVFFNGEKLLSSEESKEVYSELIEEFEIL